MRVSDICLDENLQETIFFDDPLFNHSFYIVEYDYYVRDMVPWHWHNQLELIYLHSGSCVYQTGRAEYHLRAGDAIYLNPGVLHMLHPTAENTVSWANIFDRTFLSGASGDLIDWKYVSPVLQQTEVEAVPIWQGTPENDRLLDIIRQTGALCRTRDRFYEIQLRNLLSEIWISVYARVMQQTHTAKPQLHVDDERTKRVLIYIQEHYPEPIPIAALAAAANISERECFRLFRQRLGTTPALFVRQYRIQKAKTRLEHTEDAITEIALACGFENSSYFTRVFREQTGTTPRRFRQYLRGE